MKLSAGEEALVATIHDFVQRQVKPVVRDLEHANTYPGGLIETMKAIGVFGLAIPSRMGSGRCRCRATSGLPRSSRAAG